MRMMRKTLAQIVKDTTPIHAGMRSPLKDGTVQAIRDCFGLIAERERELMEADSNFVKERPRYADERRTATVIPINEIKKGQRSSDSE